MKKINRFGAMASGSRGKCAYIEGGAYEDGPRDGFFGEGEAEAGGVLLLLLSSASDTPEGVLRFFDLGGASDDSEGEL